MASLTIRNLTSTPLELKTVERFEGQPVAGLTGNATINAFAGAVTGFLNGTALPVGGGVGVTPQGEHAIARDDVSVHVGPFETKATDIRAADPGGREVLRLTIEAPPGSGHRYGADCPAPSPRSFTMRRLGEGSYQDLTAVYVASGGFLAVLGSTGLSDWMSELRDELPLSALSMPGTHNSPTCHKALPSVRCQAVGVREQLDNGVRFLDVRVSVDQDGGPDLALVHSAFPISLTGNKYLRDMVERDVLPFLDAHPRETVVVSLKREGTGKGTDQQLSRAIRDHYAGAGGRWFVEPRIPRLGEARGKIVLVRRFALDDSLHGEHGGAGWGLDAQNWPDNCADGTVGSGLIRVQDFYEVTETTNIEKKIELARAQLERAAEVVLHDAARQEGVVTAQAQPPPPFFVNFLTASNFFNASCWPDRIAARVNPGVVEYLCMRHGEPGKGPGGLGVGDAGTGIVVTDWVGNNGDWDLVRCIVAMNARLQMKLQ